MNHWYEEIGMGCDPDDSRGVNPATGLPMINDAIDVGGNPFGTDLSDLGTGHDAFGTGSFDIGGFGSGW